MSYTTDFDGTTRYFPRPNKRVIQRLAHAVSEFRVGELEDSTFSPARARAIADAAEVMLLELAPQIRQPSDEGRDYERLGPDGERL